MSDMQEITNELRAKANEVFGESRVSDLSVTRTVNQEGSVILRITLTYSSEVALTAEEMAQFLDLAWSEAQNVESAIPVVDFLDLTDVTNIAAE